MKNTVFVLAIVLSTFTSMMWAYPVYDIGMGFLGLNRSTEDLGGVQYRFQGIVSKDLSISSKSNDPQDVSSFKKLMMCYNPYYLRCERYNTGITLWKSENLFASVSDDSWGDVSGSPQDSVEYQILPIDAHSTGILLFDRTNNQYVFKLDAGDEIRLPKAVSDYRLVNNVQVKLSPKMNSWTWVQTGDDVGFEMAIVSYDGRLISQWQTNLYISNINQIYANPSNSRYVIDYNGANDKRGMLILSAEGGIVKNYPDYNPGNVISFYPFAQSYIATREGFSKRHILDLESGEIVAEIHNNNIDLAIIDNSLVAVAGTGKYVCIFTVVDGQLLQDMTDLSREYEVSRVRFYGNGEEMMYCEKQPNKSTEVKRYLLTK
jgi:hypothetical protein